MAVLGSARSSGGGRITTAVRLAAQDSAAKSSWSEMQDPATASGAHHDKRGTTSDGATYSPSVVAAAAAAAQPISSGTRVLTLPLSHMHAKWDIDRGVAQLFLLRCVGGLQQFQRLGHGLWWPALVLPAAPVWQLRRLPAWRALDPGRARDLGTDGSLTSISCSHR
eukprot:COSAG06_NODE_9534_length_1876_cov_0.939786_2_plen_166_part_00